MSSRIVGKVARKAKVALELGGQPPFLKIIIPAQQAIPAPPLGPQLGKRNINITNFCNDFNERTKNIKEGTPIPCSITVKSDRSYSLLMTHPPSVYLLRLAAAVKKGASDPGKEVCGYLTLKHIYHIAELKKQDPELFTIDLEKICRMLIGTAHNLGIEVLSREDLTAVPPRFDYTPSGYAKFMKDREVYLKQKKEELDLKKQAKMSRL